jgi:DNA-binding CsgD family transcriptional regulator
MSTAMVRSDLAQPLRSGLARLHRATGADSALGGLMDAGGGRVVITELHNTWTNAYRGTVVVPGAGAGGRALLSGRPLAVNDYLGAATITHHYDRQAQTEQVFGTFVVPVRVDGRVGALVWGLVRSPEPLGDRVLDAARPAAARLAHDLAVEIEVTRRLANLAEQRRSADRPNPGALHPLEIREELLSIPHTTCDPSVRDRLTLLCERLSPPDPDHTTGPLTPRERDVLTHVALGLTNDEVAQHLAIMPTTVKSYLKNAMRKFGTRNRVETISAARKAGLIR